MMDDGWWMMDDGWWMMDDQMDEKHRQEWGCKKAQDFGFKIYDVFFGLCSWTTCRGHLLPWQKGFNPEMLSLLCCQHFASVECLLGGFASFQIEKRLGQWVLRLIQHVSKHRKQHLKQLIEGDRRTMQMENTKKWLRSGNIVFVI